MCSRAKALMTLGALGLAFAACGPAASGPGETRSQAALTLGETGLVETSGTTIGRRFRTPEGFVRTAEAAGSFGAYLRDLPLKPHGATVRLYDGRAKGGPGVHEAVVDLDIGRRDRSLVPRSRRDARDPAVDVRRDGPEKVRGPVKEGR